MKLNYKVQEVLLIDKTLHVPTLYTVKQLKNKARKQKKEYRSELWGKLHREWKTSLKENKLLKIKQEQDRVTIENLKNEIENKKFEMFYEQLSENYSKVAENSTIVMETSNKVTESSDEQNIQPSKPPKINAPTSKTTKINVQPSKFSKKSVPTSKTTKINVNASTPVKSNTVPYKPSKPSKTPVKFKIIPSKTPGKVFTLPAKINALGAKTAKINVQDSKCLKIKLKSLASIQTIFDKNLEDNASKVKWYKVASVPKSTKAKKPQPVWKTYNNYITDLKHRPEPLYVPPRAPKKSAPVRVLKNEPMESSDLKTSLPNNPCNDLQQSTFPQQQFAMQQNIPFQQQQIHYQQSNDASQLNYQQQNSIHEMNSSFNEDSFLNNPQSQQMSLSQRQQEYRNLKQQ